MFIIRGLRGKLLSLLLLVAFIFCFTIFNLAWHEPTNTPAQCPHMDEMRDEMKQLHGEKLSYQKVVSKLEMELKIEKMKALAIKAPPDTPKLSFTPKPTEYANQNDPPSMLLDSDLVTNNVYYMWCGRRWFEFNHYLSIKSVIRLLRPDNIIFMYDYLPIMDSWTYNTWFDELRQEYPFLRIVPLRGAEATNACSSFAKPNITFIRQSLFLRGGLYVNENTILSEYPLENRKLQVVSGLNEVTMKGFLMMKPGFSLNKSIRELVSDNEVNSKVVRCVSVFEYNESGGRNPCVDTKLFFPKDIWELKSPFGNMARTMFYGNPDINLPVEDDTELIPNIAHMVWLGGGKMDFLFYLAVMSLIYVAEVDMVYIHGNAPPTGPYWERIKNNPKLRLVYREPPQTVYGTPVDVLSHVTDVWRVDFMVKYGGIYMDTDAVFVKPLDRRIRSYDAVGAYDWTYWNHPFPDSINFGVAIGKRNAKYWQLFQKSMSWFMDNDWSWNGLRQPYRLKERHPDLVKIDPHLQVICFESKCHPTWYPDYHNESRHHLNTNIIKSWKDDVYAFHWTMPTPHALLNEYNLVRSQDMFGDIAKFILDKAGVYDDIVKSVDGRSRAAQN